MGQNVFDGAFYFVIVKQKQLPMLNAKNLKVIGNKYENPELLGVNN